jgi:autoinducer 2-degrading protein
MQLRDDLQAEHTWASEVVIRLLRAMPAARAKAKRPTCTDQSVRDASQKSHARRPTRAITAGMRAWHWESWLLAALDVRPGRVGALAVGQDMGMLVVHVHVRVLLERMGDFLAATLVNARASLAEPGVLRFDVVCDEADPAHVVLTEVYRDDEAAAAHKLTAHYAAWRDAVAEMMAVPRESAKFAAVFPAGDEGWKSGLR